MNLQEQFEKETGHRKISAGHFRVNKANFSFNSTVDHYYNSFSEWRAYSEKSGRSKVSDCCKHPVKVSSSKEGTNHYRCEKCNNPCDVIFSDPPKNKKEPRQKTKNMIIESTGNGDLKIKGHFNGVKLEGEDEGDFIYVTSRDGGNEVTYNGVTWSYNKNHQPNTPLEKAVKTLKRELSSDTSYRESWEANIAMAFKDSIPSGKLNRTVLDEIARKGAKRFIDLFTL